MGMYNEEYLCKSCWHRFLETEAYCDEANMLCPKCKSNLFEPIDDIEINWLINKCKDITKKYYNKLAETKTEVVTLKFHKETVEKIKEERNQLYNILSRISFTASIKEAEIIEKIKKEMIDGN